MTNYIEQAIKKAIEKGGYDCKEAECRHRLMADESGCPFGFHYPEWQVITSDPLFWQALSEGIGLNKADTGDMGKFVTVNEQATPTGNEWSVRITSIEKDVARVKYGMAFHKFRMVDLEKQGDDWWIKPWYRFIEHLAENKDPNSFFKELLTQSK